MSSESPIDSVILDLDGTLVDSVYQHVVAWRSAFLAVGTLLHGALAELDPQWPAADFDVAEQRQRLENEKPIQ